MKKWICLLLALPLFTQAAEIRIGFQKSAGLLSMMKTQGSVEKSLPGHQIKWIEFPAGPQMLEALNAGSIDFGSTGAPPPVFAQAAGIDLLYVGAEPAPVNSEALFVPKDSPARSVADLKGKRIAFQKGSGSHFLLASALQKAGLKFSDITPVYLSPSDARAAFVSGGIDAWVVWDPYFASAQKAYQVRVLSDYSGLPLANGFYLASRKFAEQSPQLVSALLEQVKLTGKWASEHQKEVSTLLTQQTGVPADIVATWMQRSRFGATPVTPDIVANQQRVADLFYQQKLIPKAVNIASRVWTWQPK
ncbi:aliphatic sulfonate ABC transporter substrate-binding protein [Duganella sp. CY15W]|uniref:sulfonate ABC transporter substrate-binding protein n=1 Tax=Duganella sp. CY15W TaxID=2692172 RepID=UPI001369C383|nr:sulfonate ABC transporter substrate-binding protein [Duganella sp. CY15W]MYM28763.1 aliphatic sulfonate ABC transporter substrate-binding protein [Duganella sp. CY15W]